MSERDQKFGSEPQSRNIMCKELLRTGAHEVWEGCVGSPFAVDQGENNPEVSCCCDNSGGDRHQQGPIRKVLAHNDLFNLLVRLGEPLLH